LSPQNASFISVGSGDARRKIACRQLQGRGPCIVWLGGFKSDMQSTKALALEDWARAEGRAFLRFDYSGHGESESAMPGERFIDGTISRWLEDALAMFELTTQPLLLVGSSMGGWISLLAARDLAAKGQSKKLAGMVLIAPAVDFTQALMWPQFSPEIRAKIENEGVWYRETPYSSDPMPITRALIEDGRKNLLFGAPILPGCPVHIVQGQQDPDVPWPHAVTLMEHLPASAATLTLIKDGDHRLSRQQDIALLIRCLAEMAEAV